VVIRVDRKRVILYFGCIFDSDNQLKLITMKSQNTLIPTLLAIAIPVIIAIIDALIEY
jgi:hypothetical protein